MGLGMLLVDLVQAAKRTATSRMKEIRQHFFIGSSKDVVKRARKPRKQTNLCVTLASRQKTHYGLVGIRLEVRGCGDTWVESRVDYASERWILKTRLEAGDAASKPGARAERFAPPALFA